MAALPDVLKRWVTFLLPPLAVLLCCLVMVPRHNKLQQLNKELAATRASVDDYVNKLRAVSELPPNPEIATMPFTRKEQSDFLRGLSALCSRTGNRLLGVTALAPPPPSPPPPPGSPPPPPPPPGSLPPDVIEIKSTIIFEGSFTSLRAFLLGLQQSRRLITLNDCRIGLGQGGYPNLQTTLTIARYVDAPAPATPSPAPSGNPPSSSQKAAGAPNGGPSS